MNQANFRFLGELNDFLPPSRRKVDFPYGFDGNPAVKHLIEAAGVPHTEVHQVKANGTPVDLTYHVQDGDQILVYPISLKATQPGSERSANPDPDGRAMEEPRFILDLHLGRLARYLRMLGFDVAYRNDYQDEELAEIAHQEKRILLTRDRRLLMRSMVTDGYCVRELDPKRQVIEIMHRFDLIEKIKPFQRCLRCNNPLKPVSKEAILDRLEPLTKAYFDEFHICPACGQIYWKGSHYERMRQLIEQMLQGAS